MNKVIIAILIWGLAGCATYNVQITDEQLKSVKKLGIVSLVGSDISYSYVGVTVFNNENKLFNFPELDIDNHIINEMKTELPSANNKVEIVPIPVERSLLASSYRNPENLSGFDLKRFVNNMTEKTKGNDLSHILVISRDFIQFDEVPVKINGIGLRKHVFKDDIGAFIFLKFQLIDVKTKKEVSNSFILKKEEESPFPWLQPFEKNTIKTKLSLKSYFQEAISENSMQIARMLIGSPKEMKTCSDQVFSKGFEVDGQVYFKREEVTQLIRDFRYKKIVKENVAPENANPSYINRFNKFDEQISECLRNI
ncbi:hypothetical protein [Thalassomonas sp. RHCl1]|uniref:hypothetical protein n=1 Tax=Thalassomonas sp. RHCl1 TaxID=2995320 RepID=UPI00248AAC03|nr:hypothetical protein [Thalassomonas sp. RHCl1]